jgi:beta-phosphoglucomutase-like phosphatase (HAD superfamily)
VLSALLFDVDGTLADTEEAHRRAFNAAFRAHGLDWFWSAELYGELLGITGGKERLRAYLDRLPLEAEEREHIAELLPRVHATKTTLFTELVHLGGMPLRTGVRRLIEEARLARVAVAVASTTTLENVRALLSANFGADAQGLFDTIAAGDVVRHKKPAPDIYELALERLGIPAASAVAIEDSEIGLQSAKRAGLFTIVTPNRWTASQRFDAADLVLSSLGDPDEPLAAADAKRIDAPYLRLEHIQALHSRAEEFS